VLEYVQIGEVPQELGKQLVLAKYHLETVIM
jgi:hypothetical protein